MRLSSTIGWVELFLFRSTIGYRLTGCFRPCLCCILAAYEPPSLGIIVTPLRDQMDKLIWTILSFLDKAGIRMQWLARKGREWIWPKSQLLERWNWIYYCQKSYPHSWVSVTQLTEKNKWRLIGAWVLDNKSQKRMPLLPYCLMQHPWDV